METAIIRSKGDQALFRISAPQLKTKLGIPDNRPLADFLPTISIKSKDLAAEMTSLNVQTRNLRGQKPIEKEHVDNRTGVRDMLLQRGISPENLPPADDVKKVRRKLDDEGKKILKEVKKPKK
jgi:DNA-damage-inducible protein D